MHFGTANDSAEDYYYVQIGDATLAGLGLREGGAGGGAGAAGGINGVPILGNKIPNGQWVNLLNSGLISFGIIPAGTKNLRIEIDDWNQNDDIEIFDRTGKHLAGTGYSSRLEDVLTEDNGFLPGAQWDWSELNGIGGELTFVDENTLHHFTVNGMNFGYTGSDDDNKPEVQRNHTEVLTIDEVKEDIILVIAGAGSFNIKASWTAMPGAGGFVPGDPNGDIISIKTQELAQRALNRLDNAIVRKDQIRAHLGATQNRLENTVTNLTVQAESLQAAESRISDVDVATEMTTFVRNQVLTQSATSMLAQANTFPHMILQLLQG